MEEPFRVLPPLSPLLPAPPRTPDSFRVAPPTVASRTQTAFVIIAETPTAPRRASSPFRGRGFREPPETKESRSRIPVAKRPPAARSAPPSRRSSPSKIPRPPRRGSTPSPTPPAGGPTTAPSTGTTTGTIKRPPRPPQNNTSTLGRRPKRPAALDAAKSRSTPALTGPRPTVHQKNFKNSIKNKPSDPNKRFIKKDEDKDKKERFCTGKDGGEIIIAPEAPIKKEASAKPAPKETPAPPEEAEAKEPDSGDAIKIDVPGKPEAAARNKAAAVHKMSMLGALSHVAEKDKSTEDLASSVTIIKINEQPDTEDRVTVVDGDALSITKSDLVVTADVQRLIANGRANGQIPVTDLDEDDDETVTRSSISNVDQNDESLQGLVTGVADSEETQSSNRPKSRVSFRSPEMRTLESKDSKESKTSDSSVQAAGLWGKLGTRVYTCFRIGKGKKQYKKEPDKTMGEPELVKPKEGFLQRIRGRFAFSRAPSASAPEKETKGPNAAKTEEKKEVKKDVKKEEKKEEKAKTPPKSKVAPIGTKAPPPRGILSKLNCFRSRGAKTINRTTSSSSRPWWKRLSCRCPSFPSCSLTGCCSGNKVDKKGKSGRKSSLLGFPKLDAVLVEHNSVMRGAIPVLPICLAWFCLLLNVFLPGTGTIMSGMLCMCFGKPRFSVDDTSLARFGAFCVNLLVGLSQTFTVIFCLVGWGWSVWWGVIILKLSRKYRRIKLAEKNNENAQSKAEIDLEKGEPTSK